MQPTDLVDNLSKRDDIPEFAPGDTLKVHVRVIEGNRERTQVFEGVVIRRQGSGLQETYTVRKLSFGVGVERTFPVHTPIVERVEFVSRGGLADLVEHLATGTPVNQIITCSGIDTFTEKVPVDGKMTDVERECRVDVALHPLMITDMQWDESGESAQLLAVLNAGGIFPVGPEYPLKLEQKAGGAAYIELPHGLSALCSRAAWYRLVDLADDDHSIISGSAKFFLS